MIGFILKFFIRTMTAGLLLILPQVSAAEEEKKVVLKEVVVTATRDKQEIRKIPANVTIITEEDIESSNAQTVSDLLRTEAGVVVRDWMGNGKSCSVDLRGFGETAGSNTLVLIDGRRINAIDISGVDWTQIPLDQVERIEIVRGAGSVLYGDNATGGVVNIITRRGEGKPGLNLEASYGSYELNKERGSLSGSANNLSYSFHASHLSTDGYRENNHLETRDFGGKVVYDLTDYFALNLSGSYHNDRYGMPGAISENDLNTTMDRRDSKFPNDHGDTEDFYITTESEIFFGDFGKLVLNLSFRNRDLNDHFEVATWAWWSESKRDFETLSLTPRYILDKNIFGHENKLTMGLDFYDNTADITSTGSGGDFTLNNLSANTEIDKKSTGYYIFDELCILKNLILSAGYRHERTKYDFDSRDYVFDWLTTFTSSWVETHDTSTTDEEACNIGLTYLYGEKSKIFGSFAKSFRYPATDEYFSALTGLNLELEPQTGDHWETGVNHYFTPDLNLAVTFFRMEMEKEIYYDPLTFTNNNYTDDTIHQGIELGMNARLHEKINVFSNYTYTDATFEDGRYDGNFVPAVPRRKGSLGARLDLGAGFKLAIVGNYVGKRYFISGQSNRGGKLDDYTTVDTKLSYNRKKVTAFFGVNNLFDEKYSEYGVTNSAGTTRNYYPSPRINFIGGVSFKF